MPLTRIEVGDQVFFSDGGEEVGAVREVRRKSLEIVVFIENAGDHVIPGDSIKAVHAGKVILDVSKLDPEVLHALRHAHDAEDPNK
jgi:hypothetical protein